MPFSPLNKVTKNSSSIRKEAVGQLIDVLVARQYLKRSVHPTDRRCMVLELTDRGYYAAGVVSKAIEGVDSELQKRIGAEQVTNLRTALGTLIDMRDNI